MKNQFPIQSYTGFCAIGDPHLRLRYDTDRMDYQGIQPLVHTLKAMEEAFLQCRARDVRTVYILGDLFDRATNNYYELTLVIALFKEFPDLQIYVLRGNHDTPLVHRWGNTYPEKHVLYALAEACENVTIFHSNAGEVSDIPVHLYRTTGDQEPEHATYYGVYALPYMESDAAFLEALEDIRTDAAQMRAALKKAHVVPVRYEPVLLSHQGIDPLVPDVIVQPEHFHGIYQVVNGHLHERARLKKAGKKGYNIRIAGSLTVQTLADKRAKDTEKGFYFYTPVPDGTGISLKEEFVPVEQPPIVQVQRGKKPPAGAYVEWVQAQTITEKKEQKEAPPTDATHEGRTDLLTGFFDQAGVQDDLTRSVALNALKRLQGTTIHSEGIDLQFQNLNVEGFLSYVNPVDYDLSYEGITYIQGLEGSGKSNILKALVWVLTGAYYNKGKKFTDPTSYDTYANQADRDFQGCRVELQFLHNGNPLTLVRTKGYKGSVYGENFPNSVGIVEDGKFWNLDEVPGHDDIKQTLPRNNAKVLSELGLSLEDIIYTIGIRPEYSDLISANQAEARKIFDAMIGADWVDTVAGWIKEEGAKAGVEVEKSETSVAASVLILQNAEDTLTRIRTEHAQQLQEYEARLKASTTEQDVARTREKNAEQAVRTAVKKLEEVKAQTPKTVDTEETGKAISAGDKEAQAHRDNLKIWQGQRDALGQKRAALVDKDKAKATAVDKLEEARKREKIIYDTLNTLADQISEYQFSPLEQDSLDTARRNVRELPTRISALNTTSNLKEEEAQAHEEVLAKFAASGIKCGTCGQDLPTELEAQRLKEVKAQVDAARTKAVDAATEAAKFQNQLTTAKATVGVLEVRENAHKTAKDEHTKAKERLQSEGRTITALEQQVQGLTSDTEILRTEVQALITAVGNQTEQEHEEAEQAVAAWEETRKAYEALLAGAEVLQEEYDLYQTTKVEPLENGLQLLQDEQKQAHTRRIQAETTVANLKENRPPETSTLEPGAVQAKTEAEKARQEAEATLENWKNHQAAYAFLSAKVFNPKGLKTYVIGKKLVEVNRYCKAYSNILGSELQVSVDPKGNYVFTISFKGQSRDGATLSTGWTFHSNLALLGALIQLREKRTRTNLLFIDEPFSTIPERSVQKVVDMVREVGKGKAIHIITHSQELDNNLSRLVQVGGGIENGYEVPSYLDQ